MLVDGAGGGMAAGERDQDSLASTGSGGLGVTAITTSMRRRPVHARCVIAAANSTASFTVSGPGLRSVMSFSLAPTYRSMRTPLRAPVLVAHIRVSPDYGWPERNSNVLPAGVREDIWCYRNRTVRTSLMAPVQVPQPKIVIIVGFPLSLVAIAGSAQRLVAETPGQILWIALSTVVTSSREQILARPCQRRPPSRLANHAPRSMRDGTERAAPAVGRVPGTQRTDHRP